jgi:predicted Zn-dependent protease
LLRLLVLDWRFAVFVFVLAGGAFIICFVPLKIWRRSPPGALPVIRVSLLDFAQAQSLKWSALRAERKGDWTVARSCWRVAVANDPGSITMLSGYVNAFLQSPKSLDWANAYEAAGWLAKVAPDSRAAIEVLLRAADQNRDWDQVEKIVTSPLPLSRGAADLYLLRAYFFSGRLTQAEALLHQLTGQDERNLRIIRAALRMVFGQGAIAAEAASELNKEMGESEHAIEAHEAFLVASAGLKKVEDYQRGLESLGRLSNNILPYQVQLIRLLLATGKKDLADQTVEKLAPPRSRGELMETALLLVEMGQTDHAISLLDAHCDEYPGEIRPWVLYAALLVSEHKTERLRSLSSRINPYMKTAAFKALAAGIESSVEAQPLKAQRLVEAVEAVDFPDKIPLADFACEALLGVQKPLLACQVLLGSEEARKKDPEFYRKLFSAADTAQDCELMRRAAARRYALAPNDLSSAANYAALLAMFGESPRKALDLATECLEGAPRVTSTRLNYIAALINADKIKLAEQMAFAIDENNLTPYERSHFNFLRLKIALKNGHNEEVADYLKKLEKQHLYPVQQRWLEQNVSLAFAGPSQR